MKSKKYLFLICLFLLSSFCIPNSIAPADEFDQKASVTTPPVADFSCEPSSGPAPLNVHFTNNCTGDIEYCEWDFGDGTTIVTGCEHYNHIYDIPGTYTVRLTIISPDGSNTTTCTIEVLPFEEYSQNLLRDLEARATPIQLRVPWDKPGDINPDSTIVTQKQYWLPQTYDTHNDILSLPAGWDSARKAVDFYFANGQLPNTCLESSELGRGKWVRAAHSGTVSRLFDGCGAEMVRISGTDLNGTPVTTEYLHLIPSVTNGQSVSTGQVIGTFSDRGCANLVHLMFRVYSGQPVTANLLRLDDDPIQGKEVLLDGEVIFRNPRGCSNFPCLDVSCYRDTSMPRLSTPSITVTSPNGGENWVVGANHTIQWSSSGITGNVDVWLWRGGTQWEPLFLNTPNDGSEVWNVTGPSTTQAWIMIIHWLNNTPIWDMSDNPLTITSNASITVTSPNGGENWDVGTNHTIQWSSFGITGNVDVWLWRGASNWDLLFSNTPNDGSQPWSVTGPITTQARILVIHWPTFTWDMSDANFTISNIIPCTPLLTPNPASPLCGGTVSTTTPTLIWGDVANESGYVVRIFSGSTCSGTPIHTSSQLSVNTTSYPVPAGLLQSGQSYSWQVQAKGNGTTFCDSAWSICCSFTIERPPNQPPNQPTVLTQYKSDGITEIPAGGTTNENTVVFKGNVSDPDNNQIKLQIELSPMNQGFTGIPTHESVLVPSGGRPSITVSGLANGNYHWRGRAMDSEGGTSSWVDAGNPDPNVDLIVSQGCSEVEPNNRSIDANPLTLNVSCTGKISTSTDVDWFDVFVNSGTTIGFTLIVPAGLDYDMELYGPDSANPVQHFLTQSINPAGQNESITWTTTATGFFAVRILGFQGQFSTTATYTITRTQ